MKQSLTQENYTLSERNGQVVIALNSEIMLPEDAPVRLTNAQLEELEYWRCARHASVNMAISSKRLAQAGYYSIQGRYESLHLCG